MGLLDNAKILFGIKNNQVSQTQDKVRVLVVEDEKDLGDSIEARMKQEGFEVYRAMNGREGLDLAIQSKPNVIILDLIMPVMDGKQMLHELRKQPDYKTTPVIVLTNDGTVDNMKETRLYDNASAFLIKANVSLEELVTRVKQYTWSQ